MTKLFNKNIDITCGSIRKQINDLYKTNYDLSSIHWILNKIGLINYKRILPGGKILNVYSKSDYDMAKHNGKIRNLIQNLELNKNQNVKKDSKDITYNGPIINNNVIGNDNSSDDGCEYKNNENDMEKYSEYLINNVYENKIQLTFNDLQEIIKESVKNILSESRGIKSKKLYDIIKKHGGIKSNRGIFDLHNMTDNDIIDVVNWSDVKNYKPKNLDAADEITYIELKDGKYLLAKCRGANFDRISKSYNDKREKFDGDFEFLNTKKDERYKNRYPRKEDYVWQNKDAEFIFNNPYFRKNDGNWTPERKKEVMNNIRNKRKWWNNKKE
jgi:hypothetical protein